MSSTRSRSARCMPGLRHRGPRWIGRGLRQVRSSVTTAIVHRPATSPGPGTRDRAPSPVRTYAAWSPASGRTEVRPSSSTVTCGRDETRVDDHVEHPHRPLGHGRDHRRVAGEGERPLRLDHVRLAVDLEAEHRAVDHGEQAAAAGEGRERAVGVDLGQADPPRPVVGARQLTCRTAAVGPRLRGDVVDAHDGDHATSCRTSPWAAWWRARRRRPPAAPRRSRCSSSASCPPSASRAACACG